MIVCFDVRSEKHSFVQAAERGMRSSAKLVNFQGKLALVRYPRFSFPSETSISLEMWILEDSEKHEWSIHSFSLPPMWKDPAAKEFVHFVGVTATNEFVFSSSLTFVPFHVYYYNFVKKSITRVEIQGMGAFERRVPILTGLNHVEDVKLMELF
ncbi:unnamed protein product [Brassica oleracea var. botrytis]